MPFSQADSKSFWPCFLPSFTNPKTRYRSQRPSNSITPLDFKWISIPRPAPCLCSQKSYLTFVYGDGIVLGRGGHLYSTAHLHRAPESWSIQGSRNTLSCRKPRCPYLSSQAGCTVPPSSSWHFQGSCYTNSLS